MNRIWFFLWVLVFAQVNALESDVLRILEANVKALGGEEAHRKLRSRRLSGTIEIKSLGITSKVTITSKSPDMERSDIVMAGLGTAIEGFDGKEAWSHNTFTGTTLKEGEALSEAKRQAAFYRDIELASRLREWQLVGAAEVGGRPAYQVRGKNDSGKWETYYIDMKSWLVLKVEYYLHAAGSDIKAVTLAGDYREVDGIKLPHEVTMIEPAAAGFVLNITDVQHNIAVDDRFFQNPGKAE